MMRITEAVKQLIIINVLFFIGSMALDQFLHGLSGPLFRYAGRLGLGAFYFESELFRPFQIITHMFMHGSVPHLFFNMFGLYMFGSLLETKLGSKHFLILYFVSGIGALLLQNAAYAYEYHAMGVENILITPMVGASGALMGVYAASASFFPNLKVFLLFPPIPLKLKYMVLIFILIDLNMGIHGGTNIAHFAHIGGAIFGFLLSLYWKKQGHV